MNITIPNSILDNVFTSLQPFLDKKDSSQITSHIYLETKNNQLIAKATDFEMGLYTITDCTDIKEEGIATVNGKQILDIIKRLKEGEINLYTNNENLHIKQNKSSFKLPMFNAQEFPSFPEFENLPKLEINSLELITSMKKIFPVIDINNQRRELNGALLDIKEYSYNFIATDTKRLAMIKFDKPSGKNLSLIFPRKAITEIQRLFFDNVELFYSTKNVIIKSQNYVFFSHLINGKFPDYEKILPKDMQIELNISKASIIEGIKVINSVTNDIKMTFKAQEILFESLSQDNSEAKTQIEIELPINEEIEIGINSRHVLDFLTQIHTATFTWILNGKNQPFILKSENFSTVIMPIIL
ncbi:DNA polymerase III subunit beta [Helicobacter sp.]|uniref:DNA polymerase III subunit beta n=1 Tax=Helicobacter sp. TaxID=218 RepID=UPI0025C09FB1|nr:DNA polymerase III subunit beta [Helicobacter sp.]MCI5968312.1 DNA polymerase III subunit beta [Helicobacter sp.]MDY2584880.1 DNA polymerase III subunit beta [Helicobacter sp.]